MKDRHELFTPSEKRANKGDRDRGGGRERVGDTKGETDRWIDENSRVLY